MTPAEELNPFEDYYRFFSWYRRISRYYSAAPWAFEPISAEFELQAHQNKHNIHLNM